MALIYKGKKSLHVILSDLCKVHNIPNVTLKSCQYKKYRCSEFLTYDFYGEDDRCFYEVILYCGAYYSFSLNYYDEDEQCFIRKFRYVFSDMDELYRHVETERNLNLKK